jgi:hypothetical protein
MFSAQEHYTFEALRVAKAWHYFMIDGVARARNTHANENSMHCSAALLMELPTATQHGTT